MERDDKMKRNIFLQNADAAKNLVNGLSNFQSSFDIGRGNMTVDAKSLMGVMALDLSKPLCIECSIIPSEETAVCGVLEKYAV